MRLSRLPYQVPALLVVGCGGLASSNLGEAGTDGRHASSPDSGPPDAGTLHAPDAPTDRQPREATLDAPTCSNDDAATPWSVSVSPSPANSDLSAVWGTGPGDVWAVGAGALLHWDG